MTVRLHGAAVAEHWDEASLGPPPGPTASRMVAPEGRGEGRGGRRAVLLRHWASGSRLEPRSSVALGWEGLAGGRYGAPFCWPSSFIGREATGGGIFAPFLTAHWREKRKEAGSGAASLIGSAGFRSRPFPSPLLIG